MTAFYTYIAFSQYLLIWYANMPEETILYRHRMVGSWLSISLALPFMRFFIPFFMLLCRPAKRNLTIIGMVAGWSLVVEYIDMYWVVMPVHYQTVRRCTGWISPRCGATVSICGLEFWSRFRRHKMVPVGDLRLRAEPEF